MSGQSKVRSISFELVDKRVYVPLLVMVLVALYLVKLLNGFYLPVLEHRPGISIKDPLLDWLPPVDCSWPIFILLYGSLVYGLISLVRFPVVFLQLLFAFAFMYLVRFLCIFFVPLAEPKDLIPLYDPFLESLFFQATILKRDLFFSGHFASIFLLFLSMKPRSMKIVYFFLAIALAIMILFQHVHYSYDIVGAALFSWISYILAQKFIFGFYSKLVQKEQLES